MGTPEPWAASQASQADSQENMSAHRPSRAKTLVLLLETSEVCRACSLLCTTAVCLEKAVAAVMTSASVSDSCLPCWHDLLVVPSTSLFTRTAQHPGQARNADPHRSNYILWQWGCARSMKDLVQGALEVGGGWVGVVGRSLCCTLNSRLECGHLVLAVSHSA